MKPGKHGLGRGDTRVIRKIGKYEVVIKKNIQREYCQNIAQITSFKKGKQDEHRVCV